ncbi:transposase (plasmid) [Sinorhizobium mexicanum]|uniref:Transposase n=1 Tax=Sinorhizobium mexicanum TaxID=375549 RepID=A0A859QEK2_9HYPH|nr:transposase [Sinorhizobium mexicanum]
MAQGAQGSVHCFSLRTYQDRRFDQKRAARSSTQTADRVTFDRPQGESRTIRWQNRCCRTCARTAWPDITSKRTASSGPPQQNVIERFFNKFKQFRSIATRYDKEPATFSRP